uniref:Peptidase S1 domain-containing protein n=1 Tax=Panagrolaimus davidi TaxID=227884 RepID=A0A914PU46_9BILA
MFSLILKGPFLTLFAKIPHTIFWNHGSDTLNFTRCPIQHINSSICGKNGEEEYRVNHAALPGDSGGPLMVIRDERWVQIGVVSTYLGSNFESESISINAKNTYINVS